MVDDSADDLTLVQMASKKVVVDLEWRLLDSGTDALAYITGEGAYVNRDIHPVPRLMILDLKMPRVSGFDVLAKLKHLQPPQRPFICVMSSSRLQDDIDRATALGADVFHQKPTDFHGLCELLQQLTSFFCLSNDKETATD